VRALVVYESMYGNTRAIAHAVAQGLAASADVRTTRATDVRPENVADADLLVVGGPTHAWSMSRPSTRRGAVKAAAAPGVRLVVEDQADGLGLRDWLARLQPAPSGSGKRYATFDTRRRVRYGLAGSAARAAGAKLKRLGYRPAARSMGFFVTRSGQLEVGELDRARAWGTELATKPG
jgi:flavodoxin